MTTQQNTQNTYTEITFEYENFEGKQISKTIKIKRPDVHQFDRAIKDMKKNLRKALDMLISGNLEKEDQEWYDSEKLKYPGITLSIGETYLIRLGVASGN